MAQCFEEIMYFAAFDVLIEILIVYRPQILTLAWWVIDVNHGLTSREIIIGDGSCERVKPYCIVCRKGENMLLSI